MEWTAEDSMHEGLEQCSSLALRLTVEPTHDERSECEVCRSVLERERDDRKEEEKEEEEEKGRGGNTYNPSKDHPGTH